MTKINKAKAFFNAFTGATGRHNKALRDIGDWAETVRNFINTYELYGDKELSRLLAEAGDAKFDLTGLAYNGRPLLRQAESIRSADVASLVQEIISSVEGTRRYLINPELQEHRLQEAVQNLRAAYEKLQETLAETARM